MYCTTHLQWLVIFKCQNKCSNDLSYATGQTNVSQKISHILQTLMTPHFVWWDLLKTSSLFKFELGTWHMALLVAAFAEERLDMEIRRQTGNCPGRCPPSPYLPYPMSIAVSRKDHLSFPTKFDQLIRQLLSPQHFWPAEKMRLNAKPESPITTPDKTHLGGLWPPWWPLRLRPECIGDCTQFVGKKLQVVGSWDSTSYTKNLLDLIPWKRCFKPALA